MRVSRLMAGPIYVIIEIYVDYNSDLCQLMAGLIYVNPVPTIYIKTSDVSFVFRS